MDTIDIFKHSFKFHRQALWLKKRDLRITQGRNVAVYLMWAFSSGPDVGLWRWKTCKSEHNNTMVQTALLSICAVKNIKTLLWIIPLSPISWPLYNDPSPCGRRLFNVIRVDLASSYVCRELEFQMISRSPWLESFLIYTETFHPSVP